MNPRRETYIDMQIILTKIICMEQNRQKYLDVCSCCEQEFYKALVYHPDRKKNYPSMAGKNISGNVFCSKKCKDQFANKRKEFCCGWCNKEFSKTRAESGKSKSGFEFCSRSCSISYNNTIRRRTRRSKSEILLYNLISEKYPELNILPNDKTLLGGLEVDIGIPKLNMAIEWNGVVHYKPIFGQEKLTKIKSIDAKKKRIAKNKGINLLIIKDLVSKSSYVHEKFLEICKIIDFAR